MPKKDVKIMLINELHKPARKNFIRRNVIVKGVNETYQADLVEMIPYSKMNASNKYILVVIDIFSKYVWAQPVKTKSARDVAIAMEDVLKDSGTSPKNLHTDLGKEFYNSLFGLLMKKYDINHYSTFSSTKASIVERVNRTLKNRMWREFSYNGSYKWLKLLPKIVEEYNSTVHSTINMKPKDVSKKNENALLTTVYSKTKKINLKSSNLKIGDRVRISRYRNLFDRGYTPNWTTEVFKIKQIKFTDPLTFLLEDERGENIKGGFYKEELQKTANPDTHLVEKVLRTKGNKLYVKWLGFDSSHNSWIRSVDVV